MWSLWTVFAQAAPGLALGDGVVLDPQREAIYLAVPGGGVEAVAVSSGKSLWVSTAGDFPLASAGDLVVTWKDTPTAAMRIVGLDASRRGGTAVRCADVAIPNGLPGAIDAHLGGSATVRARVRDHQIEASWSVERHYAGGAEPPEDVLVASNQFWSGSGRCATDGTWTEGAGPPLAPTDREVPVSLRQKAGLGQRFGTKWLIAYTAWEGAQGTLRLQTWDIPSAAQLSDLALTVVASPTAYPFLSLDGERVALVTQGAVPSSQIFDAATGQPLGTLTGVALSTWTQVGAAYVSSNGATVAAYDASGTELWRRTVRNRAYTGPYPP